MADEELDEDEDFEDEEEEDEEDDFEDEAEDDEEEDDYLLEHEDQLSTHKFIKVSDVASFESAENKLEAFFDEFSILSKKKPDAPLNAFKLRFLNQALADANRLIGDSYRPFPDFEQFDSDTIPTASDVVMMLAQYLRSMNTFRREHSHFKGHRCFWNVKSAWNEYKAREGKAFPS